MAQIVTDDTRDTVVVKERDTDVVREPVRRGGLGIGGVILAIVVILVLLYLFTPIL